MNLRRIVVSLIALVSGITITGWAASGVADIHGTAPGSSIQGTVQFQDTPGGLKVTARLTGVPPGPHGFHIHEFGQCGDMGKAAGSHYNPANAPHGEVLKSGLQHAHAGDLGNITAAADGKAALDAVIPNLTLSGGKYNVADRAVVLHEKVDDFSQPAGNAGGRIGCGAIRLTKMMAPGAPRSKATEASPPTAPSVNSTNPSIPGPSDNVHTNNPGKPNLGTSDHIQGTTGTSGQ